MSEAEDTLRADARANRGRILEVARDALSADPDVSLNAIAKAAGVGAGTLYRHFPSREALVLAVYRNEIDGLVKLAPSLLNKHAPMKAFHLWCDRLIQFGKMKQGIADLLRATRVNQKPEETYFPMLDAVCKLMRACESAGDIHPGADAEDFLMFLGFLAQILPTPDGEARARRLLALAFRGLSEKPTQATSSPP